MLESAKTLNLLLRGADSLIKEKRPQLNPADRAKIIERLRELCRGLQDIDEATGCIYTNMDRVIAEYEAGRVQSP